jgi:hypothetical protein
MAKVDSVLDVEMGRNATEESRQNVICQSTRLCQNYTWKNLMLSVLQQLECLRLDEASKLKHELLPATCKFSDKSPATKFSNFR